MKDKTGERNCRLTMKTIAGRYPKPLGGASRSCSPAGFEFPSIYSLSKVVAYNIAFMKH